MLQDDADRAIVADLVAQRRGEDLDRLTDLGPGVLADHCANSVEQEIALVGGDGTEDDGLRVERLYDVGQPDAQVMGDLFDQVQGQRITLSRRSKGMLGCDRLQAACQLEDQ